MSLLILTLPPGAPGAAPYEVTQSADGQTVSAHSHAPAPLLPAATRGTEVVALVPAAQLSWHRVRLPKGVTAGSPRLRPVLEGLLEDRLLDAPDSLHFALEPGASASGGEVWVAACDRAWLRAHLQALDAAQRPVTRVVPEWAPGGATLQLLAVGEAGAGWLLARGGAVGVGVQLLPLASSALPLLPALAEADAHGPASAIELSAEPAVAAAAQALLGAEPRLWPRADRLLAASATRWDLAQLDLARSGRARAGRRAASWWRALCFAPAWRPARWGLALLLLAHLVGLNAWAMQEKSRLAARRSAVNAVLTDSFPQVRAVVDAPVQMAREVERLRAASGSVSGGDLEALLALYGGAPNAAVPTAIDFGSGALRLKGVSASADQLATLNARASARGAQVRTEGDALILSAAGASP